MRTACRNHRIGYLLTVAAADSILESGGKSCQDAVEQVYTAWAEVPLPVGAKTGYHYVFFRGSESMAVAMGARLASAEYSRWSVFWFDEVSHSYKPFLVGPSDTKSAAAGGQGGR